MRRRWLPCFSSSWCLRGASCATSPTCWPYWAAARVIGVVHACSIVVANPAIPEPTQMATVEPVHGHRLIVEDRDGCSVPPEHDIIIVGLEGDDLTVAVEEHQLGHRPNARPLPRPTSSNPSGPAPKNRVAVKGTRASSPAVPIEAVRRSGLVPRRAVDFACRQASQEATQVLQSVLEVPIGVEVAIEDVPVVSGVLVACFRVRPAEAVVPIDDAFQRAPVLLVVHRAEINLDTALRGHRTSVPRPPTTAEKRRSAFASSENHRIDPRGCLAKPRCRTPLPAFSRRSGSRRGPGAARDAAHLERDGIDADLALPDQRTLILVNELDRAFDRDDVRGAVTLMW